MADNIVGGRGRGRGRRSGRRGSFGTRDMPSINASIPLVENVELGASTPIIEASTPSMGTSSPSTPHMGASSTAQPIPPPSSVSSLNLPQLQLVPGTYDPSDRRTWIAPGVKFQLLPAKQGPASEIPKIIKAKFDDGWPTWSDVPDRVKDMWFGKFMAEELNREPTAFEIMKRTKANKAGEWANEKEEYHRRRAEIQADDLEDFEDDTGDRSIPSDNSIFLDVVGGRNKKGYVYGLGQLGDEFVSSSSHNVESVVGPTVGYTQVIANLTEELEKTKSQHSEMQIELEKTKSQHSDIQEKLDRQSFELSQTKELLQ